MFLAHKVNVLVIFGVGAGKHWQLKGNLKIATEIDAKHHFGQPDLYIIDNVIAKLVMTYSFSGIF